MQPNNRIIYEFIRKKLLYNIRLVFHKYKIKFDLNKNKQ